MLTLHAWPTRFAISPICSPGLTIQHAVARKRNALVVDQYSAACSLRRSRQESRELCSHLERREFYTSTVSGKDP